MSEVLRKYGIIMAAEETVRITLSRYEELNMHQHKFKIQEAKIYELLEEIRKLKKDKQ